VPTRIPKYQLVNLLISTIQCNFHPPSPQTPPPRQHRLKPELHHDANSTGVENLNTDWQFLIFCNLSETTYRERGFLCEWQGVGHIDYSMFFVLTLRLPD